MTNKFHLRRRWKPPFPTWQLFILVLSGLIFHISAEGSGEDIAVPEINVEKTPFSLKFSVVDTENYQLQNVTCKNSKNNDEAVGNEEFICENLDPCSSYFAVLTIKQLNDETQSVVEITKEERTEYTEPSTRIEKILPSTQSINMTWQSENRTCILNFLIEAKSQDNSLIFKWTVTNDIDFLQMDGLNPCQNYTIQLKTYNINNSIISTVPAEARTEYLEPGDVELILSNNTNADSKVTWELKSPTTCVNFYYLKWTLLDCSPDNVGSFVEDTTEAPEAGINKCEASKNITDPTAKEFTITGLQGCEIYEIEFFINNVETPKTKTTFKSSEKVPGVVTISSPETGSTTANIYWNPPLQNPKCVDYYIVEFIGPIVRPILYAPFYIADTSANFDGLEPCGEYNYTIVPKSLNGTFGETFLSNFNTLEGRPSVVRKKEVVAQPFSLDISWDPPEFADLCVTGYRLSGWDDEDNEVSAFDQKTTNTSITIEGLKACVTYTIQIIPTTQSMNDGELIHIECETKSKAADAPEVDVLAVYPDRFAISARESDKNNKCETIFARIVCEARTDAPIKKAEKYVKGQLVILFNTDIGPLSPYTDYYCNAALYNIGGWSANKTFVKKTEAYFPDKPENITVTTQTNSTLKFTWNAPKYANGNINMYITYFKRVEASYFIPKECGTTSSDMVPRETSRLELTFDDLQPYTRYSIQVAAKNEFGISECTSPTMITTKPWISERIQRVTALAEGPLETDLEYKAQVIISWSSPCKSNGDIEYFLLEFIGNRDGYESQHLVREIPADYSNDGQIQYNETDLKPEYHYTVSAAVKTFGVDILSENAYTTFDAPAGIPQRLDTEAMAKARVEAYESSNPSKIAVVRFPADILKSEYGSILYVALLLSEKDCDEDAMQLRYGAMDTSVNWPTVKTWSEVYGDKNTECIRQYQTTPVRWKPPDPRTQQSSSEIEYVIGTEDCVSEKNRYCNGPLKPDTEYNLIIRLFTKSGYNDAALLEFRTEALIELTIILAGVSSCLLLAFIAGFVYLWITKRIKQRESCHGIEDSFGDIASKKFAMYYRELSKPDKIAREFKELTAVALDLSYSASEMGYNKNRYADIFPYDKNRVILDIDADGSDYINASFIDGYRRRKEYIATQGPKPESTTDFWRMVLQHNVRVIVMVTQFREGDVIKCHEYYPYKSKGINVTEKKKEIFDLYDRTELSVVHEMFGLKQKVVHFYFKKWPDYGVPTDPMHLITFVRKVKAEKIPSYSPIVVHCSAGVGRTGTFIGLDIIMQRLKNESKVNIYETVKKLRFQRMKMVQSLAQYTFLYTCTYELVKHKNPQRPNEKPQDIRKKASPESDAENASSTSASANNTQRNASDMSSLSDHRQHTLERPSSVNENNESFM
ncbi:protein tyrosine phosphatase 52F isoform X2 [Musca autumnalis]|uniref:protein tyrosine phosphatase 52F isoform X2 n=1 Tax=Musca autumnalis TaxID=221902 RepID=UPI003CF0E44B